MTAEAHLGWIHRGPDDALWLRVTTSIPGTLVLRSDDAVVALADLPSAGRHDVTVPLATFAPHPPTTWEVRLESGEASVPVVAASRAIDGLIDVRVLADGRAAELRVGTTGVGATQLTVRERSGWGELRDQRLDGSRVTWAVSVMGAERAPTGAVLRERDTPVSHDVAVERVGDDLELSIDLADLGPGSGPRTFDLWLVSAGDRLRVGRHLDDVPNKGRSIVAPRIDLRSDGAGWTVTPRFTDRSNVSVTVSPRAELTVPRPDPLAGWELDHAAAAAELGNDADDVDAAIHLGHHLAATVARMVFGVLGVVARLVRLRGEPAVTEERAIHLLIATVHATGGTIRATINTANALADEAGNAVHLTSVYRILDDQPYPIASAVIQRVLVDRPWTRSRGATGLRGAVQRFVLRVPSVLIHGDDPRHHRFSLGTDVRLYRWVRSIRSGTIVPTRSGLSIIAARFARRGVTLVAQQHVPFGSQTPSLQRALATAYRRSDAVCVLTEPDEAEVRGALGGAATRIVRIPNSLFAVDPPVPDLDAPRIVCGGRLTPVKGTDLLIEAFAALAHEHPGWEVRVYGAARADRLDAVREMVRRADLTERFRLMPPTERFDLELTKASICVVPSRHEAFGMVIIESMRCGVPVVAFDCPTGPREIITDGVDGVLVPAEDPAALATALRELMTDPARRRTLAAAGRRTAERYAPRRVAAQLETLIDEVRGTGQRIGGRP